MTIQTYMYITFQNFQLIIDSIGIRHITEIQVSQLQQQVGVIFLSSLNQIILVYHFRLLIG